MCHLLSEKFLSKVSLLSPRFSCFVLCVNGGNFRVIIALLHHSLHSILIAANFFYILCIMFIHNIPRTFSPRPSLLFCCLAAACCASRQIEQLSECRMPTTRLRSVWSHSAMSCWFFSAVAFILERYLLLVDFFASCSSYVQIRHLICDVTMRVFSVGICGNSVQLKDKFQATNISGKSISRSFIGCVKYLRPNCRTSPRRWNYYCLVSRDEHERALSRVVSLKAIRVVSEKLSAKCFRAIKLYDVFKCDGESMTSWRNIPLTSRRS